jgi:hypothetical protein
MAEKSAKTDRPSIVSALYFYKAPNTLSSCEVLTEQQRLNAYSAHVTSVTGWLKRVVHIDLKGLLGLWAQK